ncbi:MAG: SDR family NAD(P)-dependent oxidoreductase [Candidatus Binatia bacterium]
MKSTGTTGCGRMAGKVALVTGSASGIGRATVERFRAEGARVAGIDLVEETRAGVEGADLYRRVDVTEEAAVEAVVAETRRELGGLDAVVNAAGVAGGGAVHMLATEEWDRVIDVNLKGTFLVCKHVLPGMVEQGAGSIINIASIEGLEGTEGGSAYNASKGAVVILSKNMAMDYGRKGIRVNSVCPGFIDTPLARQVFDGDAMKPYLDRILASSQLGRFGRPEEIASAALFLSSEDASFITGTSLVVDGGLTAGHRVGFTELMGLE